MADVIQVGDWVEAGEGTLAVTLTTERLAGDLIAVMVTNSSNGTVTSISDSDGNTGYVASGAGVALDSNDGQNVEIWYCKNVVPHTGTNTITVTTGGTNYRAGHAFLLRNRHLTAPVDGTVKTHVSYFDVSAAATIGSLTPDEDNEIVIGIGAIDTAPAWTLQTGLTLGKRAATYYNETFYEEQTTKTARSWGWTTATTSWGVAAVGFKKAAGGGSVVPKMLQHNE